MIKRALLSAGSAITKKPAHTPHAPHECGPGCVRVWLGSAIWVWGVIMGMIMGVTWGVIPGLVSAPAPAPRPIGRVIVCAPVALTRPIGRFVDALGGVGGVVRPRVDGAEQGAVHHAAARGRPRDGRRWGVAADE